MIKKMCCCVGREAWWLVERQMTEIITILHLVGRRAGPAFLWLMSSYLYRHNNYYKHLHLSQPLITLQHYGISLENRAVD